jgi:hypothetical protein
MDVADKFEKADNKAAIVGWTSAAFGTVVIVEWLIHLPVFDVLLGFPVQLLGLVAAVKLAKKYYLDGRGGAVSDFQELVGEVVAELPGLGKN